MNESRRVLVADDDGAVRDLVARALRGRGFEVRQASDGEQALAAAKEGDWDLALLDIEMPGADGLQVLSRLRTGGSESLPVMFLTGRGEAEARVRGIRSGADDYVTKPFELAELVARVERLLERRAVDLGVHPMTRLPGSPSIEAETNRRIRDGRSFAFLYVDMDAFKAFNDRSGYAEGDRLIRELAGLLRGVFGEDGLEGFVGHVGGDDFAVLCRADRSREAAERLALRFDARAAELGASGVTISIAGVTMEKRRLDHYAKVVSIATEMKRYLKWSKSQVSRWAFDRRGDGPTR